MPCSTALDLVAVAQITHQIYTAVATATAAPPDQTVKRLDHELARARSELENVLTAVRQLPYSATKDLLDRCERWGCGVRSAPKGDRYIAPPTGVSVTVTSQPTVAIRYVSDLPPALTNNVEAHETGGRCGFLRSSGAFKRARWLPRHLRERGGSLPGSFALEIATATATLPIEDWE